MIRRYRRPVLVLAATLLIAIAAVGRARGEGLASRLGAAVDRGEARVQGPAARVAGHRERRPGRRVRRAARRDAAVRQRAHRAGQRRRSGRLLGRLRQPAEPRDDRRLVERADRRPYDADDPDYRDFYSNSSGGAGLVTGRITGLTADNNGDVYAAGADGGVWRSTTGGGNWTPIADSLPSLSSGDLELAPDGSLWYATGEANTGGTSYAGTGVYRLANPDDRHVRADRPRRRQRARVDDDQLDPVHGRPTSGSRRSAASSRTRSATTRSPWTPRLQPNPSYLPGGANAGVQNSADMNIANDLVIDPKNAQHILAALGWRNGAAYNGFYESTDGGDHWTKINPTGGLDATDVGYANFAYSSDGKKLYVINQSPKKLQLEGGASDTAARRRLRVRQGPRRPVEPASRAPTSSAPSDRLGARAASRARATARASSPGTTSRSRSTRRTRTT